MTVQEKAQQIWNDMDKNQQTGVRFGLFPQDVMAKAEAEGFDGHELCIALMDCAKKNGGMRA